MKYASKKAFTMIELIFVIVIIGILAAVAIPKLAATRDDAKISEIIGNARTALGDLGTFYTSQGSTSWNTEINGTLTNATNVPFYNADCLTLLDFNKSRIISNYYLCNGEAQCLIFTGISDGQVTIANGSDTSDPVCVGVQDDKAIVHIKTTNDFGGKSIVR